MNEPVVSRNRLLKFILPSLLGVFLFLFPVKTADGYTIVLAILSSQFTELFMPAMPFFVYSVIFVSALGALVTKIFKPDFILKRPALNIIFNVSALWVAVRVAGAALALMCLLKVGPEAVISADTGMFIIEGLLYYWIGVILVAGTCMNFLLDYGLMEFTGTYASKIMRPVFKLPGRSAVDCIASWVGDAVVGVLITTTQYERGYYTKREAAVIATTFSAVSISFTLIVVQQLELTGMFYEFSLTTAATGALCGIIMPRIPPLSLKKDEINPKLENPPVIPPEDEKGSLFKKALAAGLEKAETAPVSPLVILKNGIKMALDCALVCMPTVMLIGTGSLILSYFTPLFDWLGAPFLPLLNLLQISEAAAASKCVLAGFGDMFIPAIIASSSVASAETRFIVGVLSITQLIYMSEVGALLLSSRLPLKIQDLLLIFLERTIICLLIITAITKLIVF